MVTETYERLGASIRKRREAAGLTQGAVADLIGMSRTSITNIERGRQKLLVHQLLEISEVLNVPAAQLLPEQAARRQASSPPPPEFEQLMHSLASFSGKRRTR